MTRLIRPAGPALALVQLDTENPHLPPLDWRICRDGALTGTDYLTAMPFEVLRLYADILGGAIQPRETFELNGVPRRTHELSARWRDVPVHVRVSAPIPAAPPPARALPRLPRDPR